MFEVALKIESSLIESRFYDKVESEAPGFAMVAELLSDQTGKHLANIRSEYRRHCLR
jgi:hypothetical protein